MDGELDVEALTVRPALNDLARALESFRERLDRWTQRPRSTPSPRAIDDTRTLEIVEEILAIPVGVGPEEVFGRAMDRAGPFLAVDRSMLLTVERGRLVPRSVRGFRRDDVGTIEVQPDEGVIGRAFVQRRIVAHFAGTPGATVDTFIDRFPVHEALAVPVPEGDRPGGILYVGRRSANAPFRAGDVLLILLIAERVGVGLTHEASLRRQARDATRLTELAPEPGLLAGRPQGEALSHLCAVATRAIGVPVAALALEVGPDEMHIVAACGLSSRIARGRRVRLREGLAAELHQAGDAVVCRDLMERPHAEQGFLADERIRGCALLPFETAGHTRGVLYLADSEARDFSPDELAAANVIAAMMASVVDNAQWAAELTRAASSVEHTAAVDKAMALGQMAAGLARELNNVFATILGKSRLLLARAHDEPLRDGLALLEEAAWRGADLVRRVVGLAAPGDEARGAVDMPALVRDVVGGHSRGTEAGTGPQKDIDIVTDLRSVPLVQGREAALREALASLVTNAADAMDAGGRLSISTRPLDGGVQIVVEDSGEGMSDAVRGHVFEPFFTTRAPRHIGLGLTLAQAVIGQHGGRIEIVSVPTRGTRVTLWLPGGSATDLPPVTAPAQRETMTDVEPSPADLAAERPPVATSQRSAPPHSVTPRPPNPEDAPPVGAAPMSSSGLETASILLLEDEVPVRALLVDALTRAGHRVETAPDGIAGLAKLDGGRFDVVLTDLALPQRSGLAIARSVKRTHPRIRVVLITGAGHLLDHASLKEQGVDLVLVKPFRIERAVSVVSDALRLRISA